MIDSINPSTTFHAFQAELMRHAIHCPQVLRSITEMMRPEEWVHPVQAFMVSALSEAVALNGGSHVPFSAFQAQVVNRVRQGGTPTAPITPDEYEALATTMQYAANQAELSPDYYVNSLAMHLRAMRVQLLHNEMGSADSDEAVQSVLSKAVELSRATSTSKSIAFDTMWDNPEVAQDDNAVMPVRVPTGIRSIDSSLGGGLGLGELGLWVACPGVGKSNGLINVCYSASMANSRSLLVSGEMAGRRMKHRFLCISAHIPGHLLKKPFKDWPADAKERFRYMEEHFDPTMVSLVDASKDGTMSISFLDRVFEQWKKMQLDRFGSADSNAHIAAVDWLDYIRCDNENPKDRADQLLVNRAKALGTLARRYDMAVWTAHQANRDAATREFLGQANTAGGYLINQATDISLGLSPQADTSHRKVINEAVVADEDTEGSTVANSCNRALNYSTMKLRDAMPLRGVIYQGPTLRFWDDRNVCDSVEHALREMGPEVLMSAPTMMTAKKMNR